MSASRIHRLAAWGLATLLLLAIGSVAFGSLISGYFDKRAVRQSLELRLQHLQAKRPDLRRLRSNLAALSQSDLADRIYPEVDAEKAQRLFAGQWQATLQPFGPDGSSIQSLPPARQGALTTLRLAIHTRTSADQIGELIAAVEGTRPKVVVDNIKIAGAPAQGAERLLDVAMAIRTYAARSEGE